MILLGNDNFSQYEQTSDSITHMYAYCSPAEPEVLQSPDHPSEEARGHETTPTTALDRSVPHHTYPLPASPLLRHGQLLSLNLLQLLPSSMQVGAQV